jgi:hypothetical protein
MNTACELSTSLPTNKMTLIASLDYEVHVFTMYKRVLLVAETIHFKTNKLVSLQHRQTKT